MVTFPFSLRYKNAELISSPSAITHGRYARTWTSSPPSLCKEAEEDCTIDRKTALNAENPAEEILANFPNGHSLDFSDIFCGPTTCRKVIGNIYVYRDSNHITDELAATFSPEMDRQVQKALWD